MSVLIICNGSNWLASTILNAALLTTLVCTQEIDYFSVHTRNLVLRCMCALFFFLNQPSKDTSGKSS